MCGIAGSTNATGQLLAIFTEHLHHRGPDANGIWLEQGIGLAHTRLAVIDPTPGGTQPMVSDCGRFVLSYNGEIYNYQTIKAELEATGERFHSKSDTEVLLALLCRYGAQALHKITGMFAFALWDRKKKKLLLARDQLGIKPLVYAPLASGHLAFASEIEALKAHPGVDLSIDHKALSTYLACLYIPAPKTIYTGIRKLQPGHILQWENGKLSITSYWQPVINGKRVISHNEAVEEILPLVRQAVRNRLVADVPVGCFLSGGLDSSVIAACMAEEAKRQGGPPIRTFTMTFKEGNYNEQKQAHFVAKHIGAVHTEIRARPHLIDLLHDYIKGFGEPFGNPTAFLINDLSRKAREHVTVALVGDGGDEVFAGYPRYRGGLLAEHYRKYVPACIRKGLIAPMAALIRESSKGHHSLRRMREFLTSVNFPDAQMYASWVEYFNPEERRRLLGLDVAPVSPIAEIYEQANSGHSLDIMQETDLLSFLPGNLLAYGDTMSMRHALELRLPLIDHNLIETIGQITPHLRTENGMKSILKGIAHHLLPDAVINAPKRGLNLPMGIWLNSHLTDMVHKRLASEALAPLGIDGTEVSALITEQKQGKRDVALKIWSLLVLEAWWRTQ